jgi:hypothetical protein
MSVFAHPMVFRASAIAPAPDDPWAPEGLQMRVRVWNRLGFPIHPFAAWRIRDISEPDVINVLWPSRQGDAPFDVGGAGGTATGTVMSQPAAPEWIWLEAMADDGLRLDVLDRTLLPNGDERVLATRRATPYGFGGTAMSRLRAEGGGVIQGVRGLHASQVPIGAAYGEPHHVFGPPYDPGWWWAGMPDPRGMAKARLYDGLPRRVGPPDRPDGAFDPTDPNIEVGHVLDYLGPALIDAWWDDAYGDPAVVPVMKRREIPGPPVKGHPQVSRAGDVDTLLTMAVDPRIARYLGLTTALAPGEADILPGPNIWIVAAQWAVQRDRIILPGRWPRPETRLGAWLADGQAPPELVETLDNAFPGARDIKARLEELNARDPEGGPWSTVSLMAVAVAAGGSPPDPPDPPALALYTPPATTARYEGQTGWNPRDTPGEPESWTQAISLGGQPSAGMIGAARLAPGPVASMHRLVPENGPDARALPLLPAWSRAGGRVITDATLPPDPGGAAWRFWQADEFGRWSDAAEIGAPLPTRPDPPAPQPELMFTPAAPAATDAALPPGTLRILVPVPATDALLPGARPIAALELALDGDPLMAPAIVPGTSVVLEATPRPFQRAETAGVTVTARFLDVDGRASADASVTLTIHDPRPPHVTVTSPRLIWCSPAGPSGASQLALQWPASAGAAGYRVYLGDERRLAATLGLTVDAALPRCVRAKAVWDRRGQLHDKRQFTLLNEALAVPDANGIVRFTAPLSGSLRGVQFVRIVPVSGGGAEADFAACGLTAAAVPLDERPPAPSVRVTAAWPDGARLAITADGVRQELLDAMGQNGAARPMYRLRRTCTPVTDPRYVPIRPPGSASMTGTSAGWMAEVSDGAPGELPAFVRHTWFAEIGYPPEAAQAPGTVPPGAQSVQPLWASGGGDAPIVWSAASLPCSTVLAPPDPPAPPTGATFTKQADGSAIITLPGPPVAHPDAIGPYRVEVYRHVADQAPAAIGDGVPTVPGLTITDASAGDGYALVLVDPLGRRSAPAPATEMP